MKLTLQIAIVFSICLMGEFLARFLPLPGSIISMIVLFALLFTKVLKIDHIREKGNFLLKNMAFFFIPAGVSLLDQYPAFKDSILPLLAVCIITTFLTFAATAGTVHLVIQLQNKIGGR